MSQTMTMYKVESPCGVENEFEDEDKALDGKDTHEALCDQCGKGDVEVVTVGEEDTAEAATHADPDDRPDNPDRVTGDAYDEAGSESENKEQESTDEPKRASEIVEESTDDASEVENLPEQPSVDADALDNLGDELDTDPLSILSDHMKDKIQGTPAVNKRGYAMIAERYGIEASADIKVYPWENDEGRCVAKAVAKTEDGKEYTGWATASAEDGDMEDQLIELAETRSLKRSLSWSSGVGIVSYQELKSELE